MDREIPARTVRLPRNNRLFIIFVVPFSMTSSPERTASSCLLRRLSQHERFQCQPRRIILRGKLLASAMMSIATGLFGERVLEERALQIASLHDPLDQLEILPRLLFVPTRATRRKRHQ